MFSDPFLNVLDRDEKAALAYVPTVPCLCSIGIALV